MTNSDLKWLEELNPEQRKAVIHGSGPLLVVAGAGTGKTKTLAYRVAYLIAAGTDPERILLLTFTRRAAEEMLKRASAIITRGTMAAGHVWGGTFHAMGNRLLRIYAKSARIDGDFTVMDQSDAEDMMSVIRHDLKLDAGAKRFPRKATCLAIYSLCVNGSYAIADAVARHFPWCDEWCNELKAIFHEYVRRKQDRNVLDYDDLLLYWARLLDDERLAREIGGKFDHILVDEYQDTNPLQAQILRGMRRHNGNIMAVGDDAQSIYSFRAAAVRNMFDFPSHFPGAAVVTLEQNYRSITPVLETTNKVIAQARQRYTKELWSSRQGGQQPRLITCHDESAQDKYVVERVLEHYEQGVPLKKQAVLFRAAYLSASLELELARRNIPYHKYGGLRFLEAAHVKDLIAFLRIVENPRDEMAWFRILRLFDGVGAATASRAIKHVREHGNDPKSLRDFTPPPAAREIFKKFTALLDAMLACGAAGPAEQVQLARKFYDPMIAKLYDNPVARSRDLEHLEHLADSYDSRSLFLANLQIDPPNSTSDFAGEPSKDDDWLVLSTIHSAKGCEWDAVYLIHAADGCLPSDMSTGAEDEIEEELRLAYVAMTRARDFLYVTWPVRYYHKWYAYSDRHSYVQLSRFFTQDVLRTMETIATGQDRREDISVDLPVSRDINAEIRSMWE